MEVLHNKLMHLRKVGDYNCYTVHFNGNGKCLGKIYMEVDGEWVYDPNDITGFMSFYFLKSILSFLKELNEHN